MSIRRDWSSRTDEWTSADPTPPRRSPAQSHPATTHRDRRNTAPPQGPGHPEPQGTVACRAPTKHPPRLQPGTPLSQTPITNISKRDRCVSIPELATVLELRNETVPFFRRSTALDPDRARSE